MDLRLSIRYIPAMRDYLSIANLKKALVLGGAATLMAVPRILYARMDPWLYLPAAFAAMTLSAGAATAWGHYAGMHGLFPPAKRLVSGVCAAAILSLLILPLYLYYLDPILRPAMEAVGNAKMISLRYPPTAMRRFALMLWAAGFETLFFRAAALSFFCRLTHRRWVAVVGVVMLRLFATWLQISITGITGPAVYLYYGGAGVIALLSSLLFIHTGLPAAMLFAAGLNLHLFFPPA